ncbi:MAG: mechanosensitive ion channel [Desulfobacterales bacterium]|nr:mechanosensitive ion channel [Desulfobacterales bacterium]
MKQKIINNLINIIVFGLLFLFNQLIYADTDIFSTTDVSKWQESEIDIQALKSEIESITKLYEAIPADTPVNKVEGQKRNLLGNRIELIQELIRIFERKKQIAESIVNAPMVNSELDKEIEKQRSSKTTTKEPDKPSNEEFERIKAKYEKKASEIVAINEEIKKREKLMLDIPNLILKEKNRYKTSIELSQKIKDSMTTLSDPELKGGALLQIENSKIDAKIAEERIKIWEQELEFEKTNSLTLYKKLDLAKLIYAKEEEAFQIYKSTLKKFQETTIKNKEDELIKKEEAVKLAVTSLEKFIAEWETKIARINKNIADLTKIKTDIFTQIAEQQKIFELEKKDFNNLADLIHQVGSKGHGAEILKTTFSKVGQRRKALDNVIPLELQSKIDALKDRKSEVDGILYGLRENLEDALASLLSEEIEKMQDKKVKVKIEKLLEEYRKSLSEEKIYLFDVITDYHKLGIVVIERQELLNDLEKFVLSRVFWIQDASPINVHIIKKALIEIGSPSYSNSLINSWRYLVSPEVKFVINQYLKNYNVILFSVVLFILLPMIMLYYRKSLNKYIEDQDELACQLPTMRQKLLSIVTGAMRSSVLPIYLIIASFLIESLSFNPDIKTFIVNLIYFLSIFCFFWNFSKFLFSQKCIGLHQLGIPEDLSKSFYMSFRLALMAYLFFFIPWILLKNRPFEFEALPRLFYTSFEILIVIAIYMLIRKSSPLSSYIMPMYEGKDDEEAAKFELEKGFFSKHWGFISRASVLFMFVIIGLDVLGFRFGAMQLSINGLLSLGTILMLIGLHRGILKGASNIIEHGKFQPPTQSRQTISEYKEYLIKQINNFLRFLFIILGLLFIATYWGINKQAISALNEYSIYSVTLANGSVDFVKVSNLLSAMFTILTTFWLIKYLPDIFELTLFNALKLDSGARYAFLTIGRYMFFIIGLILSLSMIKVDLSQVGMLVAAISVGIGFGLQEIVANFISGIILLVERPIRVGDRITIGESSGDITHINIRSTTVRNFDQQEILVPNKDFITKEVINWTLSDRIIRVVVTIGVAYGSDVDKVRDILVKIAKNQREILKKPEPEILFLSHGESSLDFDLRVYIANPRIRLSMIDKLNTLINKEFKANNIEIPFPQRDIHIKELI